MKPPPADKPHVAAIGRDKAGTLVVLVLLNVPEGEAMALAEQACLDRGIHWLDSFRCAGARVEEIRP